MNSFLRFLYAVMFPTDMLVVVIVSCIRFPKRKKFILRLLCAIVVCLALSYFFPKLLDAIGFRHSVPRAVVDSCFQFLCIMAVIHVSYNVTVWHTLFIGANCYFIQHLALCVDRLIRGVTNISVLVYFEHFGFIAIIQLAVWFVYWRKVNLQSLNKLNPWQVVPLIAVVLFVCIFLNNYVADYNQESFAFRLADAFCNLVSICCQYSILRISILKTDNQRIEELLEQSKIQYQISKQNIELINIKCHDLRHYMRKLKNDNSINENAVSEMEHIIDEYDCIVRTGNSTLDIILTEKNLLCKEKNIEFTCVINGEHMPKMIEADMYSLFGNAIDNAIEAVERCDKSKRIISLTISQVNNFVIINLQNYVDVSVEFVNGMPQTTKYDKDNHGFGAKSIKMLAQKYGGGVSFSQNDDIFSTNLLFPIL